MRRELEGLFCVAGIYVCYLAYGVLQERIYTTKDGHEPFVYTLFLLFVQCVVNALVAAAGMALQPGKQLDVAQVLASNPKAISKLAHRHVTLKGKAGTEGVLQGPDHKDPSMVLVRWSDGTAKPAPASSLAWVPAPSKSLALVGLTYIGAMLCSNEALKFVSYPMQALGKSCKMVPVMLMGVLIRRRRYPLHQYIIVLSITAGILVFNLFKGKGEDGGSNSTFGLVLLLLSLVLDGVTGPLQEGVIAAYDTPTYTLMFLTNAWAVLYLFAALAVTGEGVDGVRYCMQHPTAAQDIMIFSLCSALGQSFIFLTLRTFNSLMLATVTTTRKFFTILVSVVMFGHALTPAQWGGVALVFAGLTGEVVEKYSRRHKPHSH